MSTVEIRRREGFAEVVLSRPDVLNALNLALVRDLGRALDELAGDSGVRALILSGAGDRAFMAGADIGELLERGRAEALQGINATLFQKVEDFPWPVVAAIRGFALGGGCELALACDIRIGTPSARLGQPELRLGIIPGAGAPHRLTRLVGPGLAREMIYTGRILDAEEALRIGLLNRIVPEDRLLDEARSLVASMLEAAPDALRIAKLALNAAVNTVDRRAALVEVLGQAALFETEEKARRMQAFLDRKKTKEAGGPR